MSGRLAAAVLALALVACTILPGRGNDDGLYRDLGALEGIEAIVDAFLWKLADDERIAHHFADTELRHFRRMLIEQLCSVSGGPCVYTGDTMSRVHGGLGIGDRDFNALVEDLIAAMEETDVPTGAQNRLLARLAPMHAEIVTR